MTTIADRYRRLAQGFAARIDAVPPDDERWSWPAPCEGWTAQDVVAHLIDIHHTFFGLIDHKVEKASPDGGRQAEAWAATADAMAGALDDPAVAGREYEGMGGRTRWEDSVDRFIGLDVLVHTWDLARALRVDERLDPDGVDHASTVVHQLGDAMRRPGFIGPEVEAPADADEQERLLAFVGRDPGPEDPPQTGARPNGRGRGTTIAWLLATADDARVGALAWAEIRRRWFGAAVVGLVLGVGFAAVLAAAAGARRTETAFPRMLETTQASHLLVSGGQDDPAERKRLYDRVAALDGVEQTGLVVGVGLVPMQVPKGTGTRIEACSNAPFDRVFGSAIDRPNLLEGRLPRPDRIDEVAVTHDYAETFGVGVGDELDLVLNDGSEAGAGEVTAADGPVVHATVVGIGVVATGVVPVSDLDGAPQVIPSPALAERHAQDQDDQCYDAAAVLLRPGGDVGRAAAAIRGLPEAGGVFILDRTAAFAEVRRSIRPQVTALWLFAATGAAATLLVVAQLLGRQLQRAAGASTPVWRALGVTRARRRVMVAAPSLVSALVGGAVAVIGAVALSGRFPIGPARLAETDRGIQVHTGLHLGGALAVVLAALVIGAAAAIVSTQAGAPSPRVGRLARAGAGSSQPAVVVGVHLAAGSGRGTSAVPVRTAAAGVALAVAAVFATVTFARGLGDLVSVPGRYGQDWDVMVDGEFSPAPAAALLDRLGGHAAVSAIAGGRYGEATIDGRQVPTVGLTDLVGATFPAIIDGRAPERSDEIVLGRRSLRDLGRSIGETVSVDTGAGPQPMTVVGTAAFPRLNHGSFSALGLGVGAMTRSEAFPPIQVDLAEIPPEIDPVDFFVGPDRALFEFATVRLRADATEAARDEVVGIATDIALGNMVILRSEQRPTAIDNYAAVRSTPVLLAVLLGSMAAATLGHLVVSVVRRRRRDLALFAALGMRRSQILSSVVIQAVLVAGVALVVGLPLGLAAGRVAWSGFAADLGVVDSLRLPWGALVLAVAVVAAGAALIAVIPALVAARTRPGLVLRSE